MTPIQRLGFFAYAMLHLVCFVLLVLHPILPWGLGLTGRTIGGVLLLFQVFRFLAEAIKDPS